MLFINITIVNGGQSDNLFNRSLSFIIVFNLCSPIYDKTRTYHHSSYPCQLKGQPGEAKADPAAPTTDTVVPATLNLNRFRS